MSIAKLWDQYGSRLTLESGEYVFRLGDPAKDVYFLLSGRVALLKDTRTEFSTLLGYRGQGELLGEASLSEPDTTRLEWALVIEPTELMTLDRHSFWRLLDEDADFRHEMVGLLIDHLVAADEGHLRAAAHERDVFERMALLTNEHDRMGELMRLRDDTMHFIIHDLRNPLNLVKSAVSMLDSQIADADEATRTIIMMAQRGVYRMLALVETLLDVDRLEEGAPALDLELLDVRAVLEDVYLRIQPLAGASEIVMTLDVPAEPLPEVMADRQRLDRVLTNLVDNALKFTLPESRIDLSTWQKDGFIHVAVDDQGPGIPADQRAHIFERFAQAEAGPQGRRGFGLGLAYCRSAILAHHGMIWAEDAPDGVGMRFIFTLPIHTDA